MHTNIYIYIYLNALLSPGLFSHSWIWYYKKRTGKRCHFSKTLPKIQTARFCILVLSWAQCLVCTLHRSLSTMTYIIFNYTCSHGSPVLQALSSNWIHYLSWLCLVNEPLPLKDLDSNMTLAHIHTQIQILRGTYMYPSIIFLNI